MATRLVVFYYVIPLLLLLLLQTAFPSYQQTQAAASATCLTSNAPPITLPDSPIYDSREAYNALEAGLQIFTQLQIPCTGLVTQWRFVSVTPIISGAHIGIFRPTFSSETNNFSKAAAPIQSFKMVGQTSLDKLVVESKSSNVWTYVDVEPPLAVTTGDYIGIFYDNFKVASSRLVIPVKTTKNKEKWHAKPTYVFLIDAESLHLANFVVKTADAARTFRTPALVAVLTGKYYQQQNLIITTETTEEAAGRGIITTQLTTLQTNDIPYMPIKAAAAAAAAAAATTTTTTTTTTATTTTSLSSDLTSLVTNANSAVTSAISNDLSTIVSEALSSPLLSSRKEESVLEKTSVLKFSSPASTTTTTTTSSIISPTEMSTTSTTLEWPPPLDLETTTTTTMLMSNDSPALTSMLSNVATIASYDVFPAGRFKILNFGDIPQRCLQPPTAQSSCNNFQERAYFDTKHGHCRAFFGCPGLSWVGEANNFRSVGECKSVCRRRVAKATPSSIDAHNSLPTILAGGFIESSKQWPTKLLPEVAILQQPSSLGFLSSNNNNNNIDSESSNQLPRLLVDNAPFIPRQGELMMPDSTFPNVAGGLTALPVTLVMPDGSKWFMPPTSSPSLLSNNLDGGDGEKASYQSATGAGEKKSPWLLINKPAVGQPPPSQLEQILARFRPRRLFGSLAAR